MKKGAVAFDEEFLPMEIQRLGGQRCGEVFALLFVCRPQPPAETGS